MKAKAMEEAGYTDLNALDEATESELADIAGIGPKLAKTIKEELAKMKR